MASDSPIVSNLTAVTLNWTSPITINEQLNAEREVTRLLQSSPASWTQADTNIQPDFDLYPNLGFPVGGEQQAYTLAVSVQGSFESAFKGQPSPLAAAPTEEVEEGEEAQTEAGAVQEPIPGTIEVSPETARIVVIGSAEFVDDIVFDVSTQLTPDRYLNSLKLVQNAVAWSTEDLDLLGIRSRGTYARVLAPLTEQQQTMWEGANYVAALVALIAIGIVWNTRRRNERPLELLPPKAIETAD